MSIVSPIPTASSSCNANSVAAVTNTSGLFGQVCMANLRPFVQDISSCCNVGAEVRVQDDCTQFCNYNGTTDQFRECVLLLFQDKPASFATRCEDVNEGISGPEETQSTTTVESSSTATLNPGEGAPTGTSESGEGGQTPPEEPGAASQLKQSLYAFGVVALAMGIAHLLV